MKWILRTSRVLAEYAKSDPNFSESRLQQGLPVDRFVERVDVRLNVVQHFNEVYHFRRMGSILAVNAFVELLHVVNRHLGHAFNGAVGDAQDNLDPDHA